MDLLSTCVTLGMSLNLSVPPFSHVKWLNLSQGCGEDLMK